MSQQQPPSETALRVSDLNQNAATPFSVRPDSAALKAIAAELELLGLRKLSLIGELQGKGATDWRLNAKLGATVVQPCGVTLEPVTTRIDVPITRIFQRDYIDVDAPEAEVPEDDTAEPLGPWIDPAQVMVEALVLALPLYPRAKDVELGEQIFAQPGVAPMRDEDARPFAGLAALREQLGADTKEDG